MGRIAIWGAGKIANEVFDDFCTMDQYDIIGIIDNDKTKWGSLIRGYEVMSPEVIKDKHPSIVVVLTDAIEAISAQIRRDYGTDITIENKYYFYKDCMLKRYENSEDTDIKTTIKYIKDNGLNIFNSSFVKKYEDMNINVYQDQTNGLFYVIHNGKKMYFSKIYNTEDMVLTYYKSILLEQDEESPHRYLSENFNVQSGDVVVDIGVAEGNFSLEIIDKVSHIYMIEADENWVEALEYTFKEYTDKVTIIKGFASSYNYGTRITLDSVIPEPVNYIKMDIEGNEWDALNGAIHLLEMSEHLKLSICCYHSDFDQELIEGFLDKHGILHYTSKGYMWFPWKIRQNYISTRLNKGIVFGVRN